MVRVVAAPVELLTDHTIRLLGVPEASKQGEVPQPVEPSGTSTSPFGASLALTFIAPTMVGGLRAASGHLGSGEPVHAVNRGCEVAVSRQGVEVAVADAGECRPSQRWGCCWATMVRTSARVLGLIS